MSIRSFRPIPVLAAAALLAACGGEAAEAPAATASPAPARTPRATPPVEDAADASPGAVPSGPMDASEDAPPYAPG